MVLDEGHDLVALQRRLAAQSERAMRSAMRDALRRAMAERDDLRAAPPPAGPTQAAGPRTPPRPPTPRPGTRPGHDLERTGLTTWPDLATIPDRVSAEVGGLHIEGFPALVATPKPERTAPVDLRVLARPDAATPRDRRSRAAARRARAGPRPDHEPLERGPVPGPGRLAVPEHPGPGAGPRAGRAGRDAGRATRARRRTSGTASATRRCAPSCATRSRTGCTRSRSTPLPCWSRPASWTPTCAPPRAWPLLSVVHELRGWADSLVADGFASRRARPACRTWCATCARPATGWPRRRRTSAATRASPGRCTSWSTAYEAAVAAASDPHPGPRPRRASGRDPLAARGAAGLALRPAARHAAAGLGQADPHGADPGLTPRRPDRLASERREAWSAPDSVVGRIDPCASRIWHATCLW